MRHIGAYLSYLAHAAMLLSGLPNVTAAALARRNEGNVAPINAAKLFFLQASKSFVYLNQCNARMSHGPVVN
jgi:hypothetical protein